MIFPVHDWQFWVAVLLMLLSFGYVVRMLVAAGRASTCHCGQSLKADSPAPKPVALTVSAASSAVAQGVNAPDKPGC